MIAIMLPSIFTIEIGDTPTLVFEAQNLREAHELCHEQWLKGDLTEAKSGGVPLWDGKAKLRARMAVPDEIALFAEAKNNGGLSDGLMLVYLVELDGEAADDESAIRTNFRRSEPELLNFQQNNSLSGRFRHGPRYFRQPADAIVLKVTGLVQKS
jgi:hypothetical protein